MQPDPTARTDRTAEVEPAIQHAVAWRVTSVTVRDDACLRVKFVDGSEGDVDMVAFLADPAVEGTPPYHLEPILDEILSHRRPSEVQFQTLSASRAETVRNLMTTELRVRLEQVVVEKHLGTGLSDGPPVVEAELGVVEGEEDVAANGDAVG